MVYWFNGLLSIEHDTFQWLNIYIMSGPTIPWDDSPPPLTPPELLMEESLEGPMTQ